MTNKKYLHELLRDDQEPFRLQNYIEDRKCQLKRPNSHRPAVGGAGSSSLQVIKRRNNQTSPIASSKHNNLCVHPCFLAFNASPEITKKSPFPNFLSPGGKTSSPSPQNGSAFLHIPARTASLLLDAAMKIQKQQSNTKPKTQIKNLGLGLFSSLLKKLKDRKRSRKREIGFRQSGNSLDNSGISGNCSRWSESNRRDRLETSSSSRLYEKSDEIDYLVLAQNQDQDQLSDASKRFCLSPLSSFRFSLQRNSSTSGGCTPIFASPSASPTNRKDQEIRFDDVNELLENFGNKEESDKDQSSPVSVLDPPFENQEEEEDCHESLDDDDEEDDYDVQCSFALVQRAKEKLLYKLSRFERLADLDPIELEKRMQDDDDDDDQEDEVNGDKQNNQELLLPVHRSCYSIDDSYVNQVLIKSNILQYNNRNKSVSSDVEKLISDLISEEKHTSVASNNNKYSENGEILVGRVCRKLEWWKATESSTIDMMAEFDMRYELDHWKRFQQQKEETCLDFEVAILGLLVEELTYELLQAPLPTE